MLYCKMCSTEVEYGYTYIIHFFISLSIAAYAPFPYTGCKTALRVYPSLHYILLHIFNIGICNKIQYAVFIAYF